MIDRRAPRSGSSWAHGTTTTSTDGRNIMQNPDTTPDPTPEVPFTEADRLALEERVAAAELASAEALTAAAAAEGKTAVFGVYDKTYERYTGDVHTTRAAAEKAARALKTSYRIDELYR